MFRRGDSAHRHLHEDQGLSGEGGAVDTNNGALSITGVLHKTFDESDKALATEPESDDILTENDMWQLGGQAGAQAGLAYVGVTEVKYLATALKIAGTLGAIKGVSDSLDHHRRKDGSVDGGGPRKTRTSGSPSAIS